MADQQNQPKPLSSENEQPEVYSVRQDKDGGLHFSRRDFLYLTGAIGGMLLLKGVCPRFDLNATAASPPQTGALPTDKIYIHAAAGIDSNIVDILQPGDLVRLVRDHPDRGWVEVATRSGQRGWVNRSLVDFSQAIKSSSPDFDAIDAPPPAPTQPPASADTGPSGSLRLSDGGISPRKDLQPGQVQYYVEVIRNGGFEDGNTEWVESAPLTIIRNDYPDPYQGSYVAWLGGNDAHETLTQLFQVPADVHPTQALQFMLKVATEEVGSTAFDKLYIRFLNGVGVPLVPDLLIADNTTPMNWSNRVINLNGMTDIAGQMMQIQFLDDTDSSNVTSFVIDQVSFNLLCGPVTPTPTATATKTATPTATPTPVYYTFLPVMVKPTVPTATPTPTRTPTLTPTPCAAHCGCDSGYCGSDCGCDSTYCSSDCRSDCGYVCVYDCPFECIYDCGFY